MTNNEESNSTWHNNINLTQKIILNNNMKTRGNSCKGAFHLKLKFTKQTKDKIKNIISIKRFITDRKKPSHKVPERKFDNTVNRSHFNWLKKIVKKKKIQRRDTILFNILDNLNINYSWFHFKTKILIRSYYDWNRSWIHFNLFFLKIISVKHHKVQRCCTFSSANLKVTFVYINLVCTSRDIFLCKTSHLPKRISWQVETNPIFQSVRTYHNWDIQTTSVNLIFIYRVVALRTFLFTPFVLFFLQASQNKM